MMDDMITTVLVFVLFTLGCCYTAFSVGKMLGRDEGVEEGRQLPADDGIGHVVGFDHLPVFLPVNELLERLGEGDWLRDRVTA